MSRQRMVTRTILSTIIIAKVANDDTDNIEYIKVNLPTELKTAEEAKKGAIKYFKPNTNITVLSAKIEGIESQIYGMPEQEFMKLAQLMPNRK